MVTHFIVGNMKSHRQRVQAIRLRHPNSWVVGENPPERLMQTIGLLSPQGIPSKEVLMT